MPAFTTILFDLDHTLLDSDASEDAAFDFTLGAYGVANPAAYRPSYDRINRALWDRVEAGEIEPGFVKVRRFEQLIHEEGLDADAGNMAETFATGLANNGDLYPGTIEVLHRLAQTHTLALITNGLSEVQRARVQRLKLGSLFSAVIISAEIGFSKPGPEIFDATFAALGSPSRSEVVIVGDSLSSDIAGGESYGIATVWFNPKGTANGSATYSYEIAALAELADLV